MAKIIEMTQLSPTMSEGTIVKWTKKIGDEVGPGEIIAEVETDKAVMEMESFERGKLLAIIAEENSKVRVGLPVAIVGKEGEDVAVLIETAKSRLHSPSTSETKKEETLPTPVKMEVSESKKVEKPVEVKEEPQVPKVIPAIAHKAPVFVDRKRTDGRLLASPLAKSMALQYGIDLRNVEGSGPEGRIVKKDIEAYMQGAKSSSLSSGRSSIRKDEEIPINSMREVIAKRLTHSKQELPHFYLNLEFDAEPLVKLRTELNSSLVSFAQKRNIENADKLSLNDFILKACAFSLREVPSVNASWRGNYILQHGRIDIGVAVALEGGLITPYIRNADRKTVYDIGTEVKKLSNLAREKKLKPDEYTDGTFTVSNLGMFGISHFTAVINEPEAAILAVGGVIEKPVVKNGSIIAGKTMTVTLSCDHRVVDGALGAKFLSVFRDYIESPLLLMR
ncbi:MAG: pyruvate dehydrogenase complex dihydrolipoamide acetyltransferase [Leptospiraceae bacterium]|nr:pyruvate dehydrogenase complex dihydrolipoamide acetyltransferase [Leptospiraceae bacterium]MCP5501473.1 pyruvate dehydrogenase complex dihydrolipoamide acetyltransferase [Leptospiraceae bacterium]